jgi:cellobiose transport system substrate-binding protein
MITSCRTARRHVAAFTAVLAVAAVAIAAGCGSSSSGGDSGKTTATNAADKKVTLTVGLFGTFGYKEAGLYDEYMALHPNITIKETSVEQEEQYYQALQTHLAAGSGLADVQGIEVGRIAEVVQTQADKFVNLNDLGADSLKGTFFPWKWDAATTADGATVGLGTDTGPLAICYRPDLFKKAGLPTDRETLAKQWATWDGFLAVGKRYMQNAPPKSAFTDSAGGLYNAVIGQSKTQYYDADGNTIYETNPAVKNAWDIATEAIANGETAKLKQFDPAWNQGFANGAFATIACPAWMIGYIKGQAGDAGDGHWDVARIPGDGGNWGGSYLAIPTASEHEQEAYDLIKWLTAPKQQAEMWTKAQHFPSSSTAASDPAVEQATDSYFSNAPIGEVFKESADNLPVATLGPKDGLIKNTFTNGLLLVEQNGQSPDSAWSKTMSDIESAIE